MPIEESAIINHDEAKELATYKKPYSNLARCYLDLAFKLGKSENDKDALSTALTNVNRQLLDAQKEIQFLKDEGDEDSEWRDQVADESEAKIKELQSRLGLD